MIIDVLCKFDESILLIFGEFFRFDIIFLFLCRLSFNWWLFLRWSIDVEEKDLHVLSWKCFTNRV